MERFVAFLIEQYKGAFPAWLAPVQARVASVSDDFAPYAEEVAQWLRNAGLRAEADTRQEKIGYKIREAQVRKIPYTLVVGEKERSARSVSVRRYGQGDLGQMSLEEFTNRLKDEVASKALLVQP
jgi:threonyl-tRNA synthetase